MPSPLDAATFGDAEPVTIAHDKKLADTRPGAFLLCAVTVDGGHGAFCCAQNRGDGGPGAFGNARMAADERPGTFCHARIGYSCQAGADPNGILVSVP